MAVGLLWRAVRQPIGRGRRGRGLATIRRAGEKAGSGPWTDTDHSGLEAGRSGRATRKSESMGSSRVGSKGVIRAGGSLGSITMRAGSVKRPGVVAGFPFKDSIHAGETARVNAA